ncbi:helix-turn-helix domain-containing protein [Crossiella sp. CA198]|uniref:helix-turn-helix domain-containing protein n=1 Tax=Crossiella sp. CA198 TaxID=3455607 RepID=UPI003F8CFC6F
MKPITSPVWRSSRTRQVCTELRALRKARRMTLWQVARALSCSVTKLQRMETGRRGLKVDDVSALLTYYQVPPAERERLLGLVGALSSRGWWQLPGAGIPEDWHQTIALEDEATVIRDYALGVVPVLLRTPDYARALLTPLNTDLAEPDLNRLVATQLNRQLILSRPNPPQLHCLVDESALLRPVGGTAVLARQLRALAVVAERPNVTVRIVPIDAGAHPGVHGSLTLLEFTGGPPMARTSGTQKFQDSGSVVDRAWRDWIGLAWHALPAEATGRLVSDQADTLRRNDLARLNAAR